MRRSRGAAMRTLFAGVAAAVVAVAASDALQENAGNPAALPAAAKVTAEDLLFMSGSWQAGGGKEAAKEHREFVEEHWTLPADGCASSAPRSLAGKRSSRSRR